MNRLSYIILLLIVITYVINCQVNVDSSNDIIDDNIDDTTIKSDNSQSFSEPAYLSMPTIAALLKDGNAKHALLELEKYPPVYRNNIEYQLNLARAYVLLNDAAKGESILLNAVTDNPNIASIDAIIALIKLYVHQQRWPLADKYINIGKEIDENNASILALQGKLYLVRDQDHKTARYYLEKAVVQSPNDEKIHFDLGMILLHANEFELGRKAFQEAERINNAIDHKVIGSVYMNFGKYEWALTEFETAVKLTHSRGQEQDIDTLLLLGQCEEVLGQLDLAISIYESVLLRDPTNAVAHAAIGLILLGVGNSNYGAVNACGLNQEEALGHLQLALKNNSALKPAEEALAFCRKEFAEAKIWRQHLSSSKTSSSTDVSDSNTMIDTIKRILQHIKDPVGAIMSVLESIYNNNILEFLKRGDINIPNTTTNNNTTNTNINTNITIDTEFCDTNRFTDSSMLQSIFKNIQKSLCQPMRLVVKNKKQKIQQNWKKRNAEMQSVPRVVINDAGDLYELIRNNKPVIITNFQDGWASSDSFSKESLEDKFGEYLVRVSVSESGRFDGPENGELWGLGPDTDVLVRPPATSMLFGDVLKLMSQSNNKETFYLEYLALHQYLGQEFLNLIPIPAQVNSTDLKHLVTNLWIGSTPTISPLHYDDYENLLCQIKGQKEVILFPPSDHKNLYYVGRPKGTLQYSYPSQFIRDKSKVESRAVVFGSSVNIDEPNLKLHPLYENSHPIRALLQPKDVLYLPAYWHHEVQSIPDENEGINVAVNFWFSSVNDIPNGM